MAGSNLHARQRRAFAGTEHAAPLDERAVRALGAEPEPSVVQKDALPFRDGAQHLLRQRDTVLAERDVRSLFERHRLTEPPDAQLGPCISSSRPMLRPVSRSAARTASRYGFASRSVVCDKLSRMPVMPAPIIRASVAASAHDGPSVP